MRSLLAALWSALTYRTARPHPRAAAGLAELRRRDTDYDWTKGRPA